MRATHSRLHWTDKTFKTCSCYALYISPFLCQFSVSPAFKAKATCTWIRWNKASCIIKSWTNFYCPTVAKPVAAQCYVAISISYCNLKVARVDCLMYHGLEGVYCSLHQLHPVTNMYMHCRWYLLGNCVFFATSVDVHWIYRSVCVHFDTVDIADWFCSLLEWELVGFIQLKLFNWLLLEETW